MNLVLVDGHPVVRKGLKALLEEREKFRVVGEAGSGEQAVALIKDLNPDLAIVDIGLPDMNGFQVAAAAKAQAPSTRIIMLSDEFPLGEAVRSGADGYVDKNTIEQEIFDAITEVMKGGRYMSNLPAAAPETASACPDPSYQRLTKREQEIFCLIAEGRQNKQIADKLFISRRTVETHRARIMRKLKLGSHAELIHFAVRKRIITLT